MEKLGNLAVSRDDRAIATLLGAADHTPHYANAVMKLGSRSEVVACEDIYAASGMLLLAKGGRIDARQSDALGKHKLARPLDQSLAASDCVDHVSLARDMDRVIAASTLLTSMLNRSGDPQGWKSVLGSIRLPAPLAFRFTVMRDETARIYQHALRVAVGAHCIGVRLGLGAEQLRDLMLAAFCQNIGEMHTDPAILAPGRPIEGHERRFIHVHPVTGFVILEQLNAIPQAVMQAVLQHHERLDGSGYPYRERGSRIGCLARILAIAETLDAVSRHLDNGQIAIVFRLHQGRLDAEGMVALNELLPQNMDAGVTSGPEIDPGPRLERLSMVLKAWPSLRAEISRESADQQLQFVIERMLQLQSLAWQAGIAPDLLELLDLNGDDAVVLKDLHTTLDEMGRLLDGLAFEIERCVPADGPYGPLSRRIIDLLLN
jgi:HD-GYP domain-containing protein (c-di-GMP phosphodiesterase class II)